ncbi:hypothetical protein [Neorhizobium galegae]|uniref:Uncharacterized protein n=1 Tax=Neorhizobium galegae bv. orientalis str. HAMBI 540 TaxID=1028800 RepID=A0A068SN93_NEOGA|nr:hypothetical protein [Neorhizobium galegae]MCQ1855924.1 hypothetical protein [Neorhizobium galegae]CDN46555.1 Hypothetical protein RG540_CH03630 [Neorhizobium galegae bv. orientalis str. HAMBI 540]
MEWLTTLAATDVGKVALTACATLVITGFGVVIGGAKDIFTDYWKRRRQVNYHAMLLTVIIDQLIDDCVEVVFDDGFADPDGVKGPSTPTPKIAWPPTLDWTLLPSDLMYKALLLPGMIRSADESAAFISEHIAGPPYYEEYFQERQDRYAKIGLACLDILNRLKKDYGVHHQDRTHYDPHRQFDDKIVKVESERAEERERQAKMMRELTLKESDIRYALLDPEKPHG